MIIGLILIICWLQIHQFAYRVNFICTLKIWANDPSTVSQGCVQSILYVPSWGATRPHSLSCFHSPFHGLFSAMFPLEFLFFLSVNLHWKWPTRYQWVFSGVPKHVKAVMGSTENTYYISLVQTWISHAVGYECTANESTVYIKWNVFKHLKHTQNKVTY